MTREELASLLEPAIERLGYELCDLELRPGGRDGLLRLFIDKSSASEDEDGGIGLEDCETVSRQVSALLDVEDPLPGHYVLEVSSPGLDRRLTKPSHFRRFMGAEVRVRLRFPLDGRRNFRGTLVAVDEEKIEVEVDGEKHRLPLATIETARLVPSL
ncbi:MAG: ribosome maturation factor RimP [Woeseiaceae bacterium]|nr:ribosome maturation factor RimP [Woeseiaceae bacterium]